VTDICYCSSSAAVALSAHRALIVGAALLFGITTNDGLIAFYEDGHGPLAALPLWLQAALFLVGADVIMYWSHRIFMADDVEISRGHHSRRSRLDLGGSFSPRHIALAALQPTSPAAAGNLTMPW